MVGIAESGHRGVLLWTLVGTKWYFTVKGAGSKKYGCQLGKCIMTGGRLIIIIVIIIIIIIIIGT